MAGCAVSRADDEAPPPEPKRPTLIELIEDYGAWRYDEGRGMTTGETSEQIMITIKKRLTDLGVRGE